MKFSHGHFICSVAAVLILPLLLFADEALTAKMLELEKQVQRAGVAVNGDLARRYALACIVTGDPARGRTVLAESMRGLLEDAGRRPLGTALRDAAAAADALTLLQMSGRNGNELLAQRPEVTLWLFADLRRLNLFINEVSEHDDWNGSLRIIQGLYDHAPRSRDVFFELILATALVWDQARPPLHGQTGAQYRPYQHAPAWIYDYFSELFSRRQSRIPYARLDTAALMKVVDLPISPEEVVWARKQTRAGTGDWERYFSAVRYDHGRLQRAEYVWAHGDYTLPRIMELGGICTDQAYLAVVTARVWGIPALIFAGQGRRGPHAWFGYMKSENNWDLNAGRYVNDKYATGHARDPQTGGFFSDHALEFSCNRSLRAAEHENALMHARLAVTALNLGLPDAARQYAALARSITPLYDLAWRVDELVLQSQGEDLALLELLEQKAGVFRRYPDYVAEIRKLQAVILEKHGGAEAAAKLLARSVRDVRRLRDDLARDLTNAQVRGAVESGNHKTARESLEQILRRQRYEGSKLAELLEKYLRITEETGQTGEAVRFLRRYIDELCRIYAQAPQMNRAFLGFLRRAYLNDKDTVNAEKTTRRIEKGR